VPQSVRRDYVDVNGMNIYYTMAGQGPPVVVLHGLGASHLTWQENFEALAENFTVYAMDIPGHGDSVKEGVTYTIEAGIAFTLGFFDAMGLSSAALVGNSMGGLIALKVALAQPERITHLSLIDTAGFGKEIAPFLRIMSLPFIGELAERPVTRSTANMLHQIFAGRDIASETLINELVRTRSLPGAKTAVLKTLRAGVNIFGMKRVHRLLNRLPELPMPITVVWGGRDRFFPVSHAYAAAEMVPTAKLLVLPEAGHWPHMQEPEVFNNELIAFLSGSSAD
jgi:pimeloyl-ACP methyl ester carboxylesterase